jgi:hypothetical protein
MRPDELQEYWSNESNYEDAWGGRAAMAAQFINQGEKWVCDIGCGPKQALRSYLPEDSVYVGADLHKWSDDIWSCNLNSLDVPEAALLSADVCLLLGVIEYLYDVPSSIRKISKYCDTLITSYCTTDLTDSRWPLWVNSYSGPQIGSILGLAGFMVEKTVSYEPGQYVMRATNRNKVSSVRRAEARQAILGKRDLAAS